MAKEYETPPTIGQLIAINNKLAKTQRDLQAVNTHLREALVKYGGHDSKCGFKTEDTECWCGFIQMQKEIKALTQKGGNNE